MRRRSHISPMTGRAKAAAHSSGAARACELPSTPGRARLPLIHTTTRRPADPSPRASRECACVNERGGRPAGGRQSHQCAHVQSLVGWHHSRVRRGRHEQESDDRWAAPHCSLSDGGVVARCRIDARVCQQESDNPSAATRCRFSDSTWIVVVEPNVPLAQRYSIRVPHAQGGAVELLRLYKQMVQTRTGRTMHATE